MTRSLKYLQKIVTARSITGGYANTLISQRYANLRGAERRPDMIFAVEDDGDDGNKVTILYAGRDGDKADALETTNSRAVNWFTIVRGERSR